VGSIYNRSHFPNKSSAPFLPKIVLLSISDTTPNAILVGILALMSHVITLTDGLCVATIRWIPTARAFCAIRVIQFSTSFLFHDIIRSANSSMTNTMRYIFSQIIFLLYSSSFLTLCFLSREYLISISSTVRLSSFSALSGSVTIGHSIYGSPEYSSNSTCFGSTMRNFSSDGVFWNIRDNM